MSSRTKQSRNQNVPPSHKKRKIDSLTPSSPNPSGYTISSLPAGLTQSTPKSPPRPPPLSSIATFSTTTAVNTAITALSKDFDLTSLSILSSTSIEKRVTRALEVLKRWPIAKGERAPLVIFTATGGQVGGKCISVVEIVKREIAGAGGGKWFQYTCVEGVVAELKKEKGKGDGGGQKRVGDGEAEEEEEEEEAFEVMKTPFERAIEGLPKVREVPVLTVYLARIRVDALRKKYGEQTNAEPAPRGS